LENNAGVVLAVEPMITLEIIELMFPKMVGVFQQLIKV
jgi:hypothetical protein